jgi:glutathione S-transferase
VRTVPSDRALRQRVEKISGQRGVPVLVDPETRQVIVDSEAIVTWLRKHRAGRALSE